MRFVFDTNVVVGALTLLGSPPRRAFDRAREHGRLLVSEATLEELDDVLRRPKLAGYVSYGRLKSRVNARIQKARSGSDGTCMTGLFKAQ